MTDNNSSGGLFSVLNGRVLLYPIDSLKSKGYSVIDFEEANNSRFAEFILRLYKLVE